MHLLPASPLRIMRTTSLPLSFAFVSFLVSPLAIAAPPDADETPVEGEESSEAPEAAEPASASGSASIGAGGASSEASATGPASRTDAEKEYWKRKDRPWIKRWAPEQGMAELGVYGGVFFASKKHELFE